MKDKMGDTTEDLPQEHKAVPEEEPPEESKRASEDYYTERFCETCKIWKPPRASHCATCDNCIKDFDHHCGTLNVCIGARTIWNFTLLPLLNSIAVTWSLYYTVIFYHEQAAVWDDAQAHYFRMILAPAGALFFVGVGINFCNPFCAFIGVPMTGAAFLLLYSAFASLGGWFEIGFPLLTALFKLPFVGAFIGTFFYARLACVRRTFKETLLFRKGRIKEPRRRHSCAEQWQNLGEFLFKHREPESEFKKVFYPGRESEFERDPSNNQIQEL